MSQLSLLQPEHLAATAVITTTPTGAKVEVGTVTHQGRKYAAGGSYIDVERGLVLGYVQGRRLTTWDGKTVIGELRPQNTWRTPRGVLSPSMTSYHAIINGQTYYGRGGGEGMALMLRRRKKTLA